MNDPMVLVCLFFGVLSLFLRLFQFFHVFFLGVFTYRKYILMSDAQPAEIFWCTMRDTNRILALFVYTITFGAQCAYGMRNEGETERRTYTHHAHNSNRNEMDSFKINEKLHSLVLIVMNKLEFYNQ